ncbi:MAG TPA: response regulator [Chitinophagaceae bacterium]|nr:response regulator [Chitinophagaceae bacterium]
MNKTLSILLVEDDPDDIELMQNALKDNNIHFTLETIKQGDAVLPYLEKTPTHPDVIVLDLNLPKMHGREVLKGIKANPGTANIPVVILTTSSAKREIDYCLENGASQYLIKPVTMDGFNKTVVSIVNASVKN